MIQTIHYDDHQPFIQDLNDKGWFVANEFIIDNNFFSKAKEVFDECTAKCRTIQINNGIPENNEGTVHHLVGQHPLYLELLEVLVNEFNDLFEKFFNGKYILNAFGGNHLNKSIKSYASQIHKDVRTFSSDTKFMINTLIMLDDFTEENGATYLLSGSHQIKNKPSDDSFYQNAERGLGKRGSVLFWDSQLWHAAGVNTTETPRCSVTPMFTKPFMKPQFDYLNAVGIEKTLTLDTKIQQVLGYFSRVPSTLKEWYQPSDKRFYRADQEARG